MPLYEYACDQCGERFEVIQKFSDEPLTAHAKCGGAVHRLISASALQFKGSGWYVNDYAKGSKSSPADNSSGDNNGKSAKTDSSSDKTAAKSDGSTTTPSSASTSTESKPSSSEKK